MSRHTTPLAIALFAVFTPAFSACDPVDPEELDAPEFRACSFCCTQCGHANTAKVNEFGIPSLQLDGLVNANNVSVMGVLSPDGLSTRILDVVDDEFVAREKPGGTIIAQKGNMVGWRILLKTPGGVVKVRIAGYDDTVPAWTVDGGVHTVYALSYSPTGPIPTDPDGLSSVCTQNAASPNDFAVTLIYGETYNDATATVKPKQNRWVTIACEGQAVAKMKLFNYGPNDTMKYKGTTATWQQRQATLKMLVADYCGTGKSYTKDGTDIYWANASNSVFELMPASAPIEARWTENGALCLDNPRLYARSQIGCSAGLPSCSKQGLAYGEWTTWTH